MPHNQMTTATVLVGVREVVVVLDSHTQKPLGIPVVEYRQRSSGMYLLLVMEEGARLGINCSSKLIASKSPCSSLDVELDEFGRWRPTQPPGSGSILGKKIAQSALPTACRELSAYSVWVAGRDEVTSAMVSRTRCFFRQGRFLLQ
ncbi:hypothetical protein SK128_023084, partial [Halocaridina rubra]